MSRTDTERLDKLERAIRKGVDLFDLKWWTQTSLSDLREAIDRLKVPGETMDAAANEEAERGER